MEPKLAGLLGIARRAGHIHIGFDAVKALLHSGKARLVLLAADCSPRRKRSCVLPGRTDTAPSGRLPQTRRRWLPLWVWKSLLPPWRPMTTALPLPCSGSCRTRRVPAPIQRRMLPYDD